MPFDPRLLRIDNDPPDDEMSPSPAPPSWDDLPDDLEALARQLSDDARYLACRYPAAQPLRNTAPASTSPFRVSAVWLRVASAVVVACGLAAWGWLAWHAPPPAAVAPVEVHLAARTAARPTPPAVSNEPEEQADDGWLVPFDRLSAPEQEAVLDLLERSGQQQASVSI